MRKNAGELCVGDIWTVRRKDRAVRSYRVIAIAPGLAPTTMRVAVVFRGVERRLDVGELDPRCRVSRGRGAAVGMVPPDGTRGRAALTFGERALPATPTADHRTGSAVHPKGLAELTEPRNAKANGEGEGRRS